MFRAGYFNESPEKGARQFATVGAGFKFQAAQLDLSYLFSTSDVRNPLENTLRFSVTLNLGGNSNAGGSIDSLISIKDIV